MLTRVFEVHFTITDVYGNDVPDATITLNGDTLDPGQHTADGLEDGTYQFIVDSDGYHPYDGEFVIVDDDVDVDVVLQPDGTGASTCRTLTFVYTQTPLLKTSILKFRPVMSGSKVSTY